MPFTGNKSTQYNITSNISINRSWSVLNSEMLHLLFIKCVCTFPFHEHIKLLHLLLDGSSIARNCTLMICVNATRYIHVAERIITYTWFLFIFESAYRSHYQHVTLVPVHRHWIIIYFTMSVKYVYRTRLTDSELLILGKREHSLLVALADWACKIWTF